MRSMLWVLVDAIVLVVVLFAVGNAHATLPVEVTEEGTSAQCGPCSFVVEGESTLYVESPFIPISRCEDRFEGEMYWDGSGHVTQLTSANHPGLGGTCGTQKCNGIGESANEAEWPFHSEESSGADFYMRVCLDARANPNGVGGHCDVDADVPNASQHHWILDTGMDHCEGINRIIEADWEIHSGFATGDHGSIEVTDW